MIWDHLMVMPIDHQERENWSQKESEFYNKVCLLIISYKRFLCPLSPLACGWGPVFRAMAQSLFTSQTKSSNRCHFHRKINRNHFGVPKVGPLLLHSYGFCSNLFTCRQLSEILTVNRLNNVFASKNTQFFCRLRNSQCEFAFLNCLEFCLESKNELQISTDDKPWTVLLHWHLATCIQGAKQGTHFCAN